MCMYMYVHLYDYMSVCAYVGIHVCNVYVYVSLYTRVMCVYVYMYIFMCVRVYVYICIHVCSRM